MSAEALGTGRPWDRHVWEGTHSLVVKAHYLATSEPILATLNALMVECTERIDRLADRRTRDASYQGMLNGVFRSDKSIRACL